MRGRCAGLPCVEEASESAGGGAVNGVWAVTAGSCGAVLSLKSTASGTKRPSCRRGNLFSITASQLHQPARRRAAPGPGMLTLQYSQTPNGRLLLLPPLLL